MEKITQIEHLLFRSRRLRWVLIGLTLVILATTIYGEFRSISALVDRNPLLRQLDSLGRPA